MNAASRFLKYMYYQINWGAAARYMKRVGNYTLEYSAACRPMEPLSLLVREAIFVGWLRDIERYDNAEANKQLESIELKAAPLIVKLERSLNELVDPTEIYISRRQALVIKTTIEQNKLLAKRAEELLLAASSLRHFSKTANDSHWEKMREQIAVLMFAFLDQRVELYGKALKFMKADCPVTLHRMVQHEISIVERLASELTGILMEDDTCDDCERLRSKIKGHVSRAERFLRDGIVAADAEVEKFSWKKGEVNTKAFENYKSLKHSIQEELDTIHLISPLGDAETGLASAMSILEQLRGVAKHRSEAAKQRIITLAS